uniref:Uncharacterized protein n=1 Tax=Schizaphis graminum TaxID=13262 RepID=A0A2S2NQE8_SCHGA
MYVNRHYSSSRSSVSALDLQLRIKFLRLFCCTDGIDIYVCTVTRLARPLRLLLLGAPNQPRAVARHRIIIISEIRPHERVACSLYSPRIHKTYYIVVACPISPMMP